MGALKGILAIVGVAMLLVGGLWALQGLDIVRWPASSFMLGDTTWTRNGVITAVVGAVLVWFARRRYQRQRHIAQRCSPSPCRRAARPGAIAPAP